MDPKQTRLIAIIVVVVVVAAGIGGYFYYASTLANCNLKSTNPLVINQVEVPDTLDPAVTFTTPGWAAVYETYQPLVMYNGSSYTNFTGLLATNWSASSDGFHYNFTLRTNVHFSNGDPFNAYTMWFSMYRTLVVGSKSSFILSQNFWYPQVSYYSPAAMVTASLASLNTSLNTFNFVSPTVSQMAVMKADNQSFRVLNPTLFQVNLGFGYLGAVAYAYLLPTIVAPVAIAVDPAVVLANGGVGIGIANAWMAQHMLGTGTYLYTGTYSASTTTQMTFQPDSSYWGASVATQQPWNTALLPAKASVQTVFQNDISIDVQNLKTGGAAAVSFVYSGTSSISTVQGAACVTVQSLPLVYGATAGSWYVYMNQSQQPFNNWSVRAAVVHAINYAQIIQTAFGGFGSQWVGPVPPSYPDYNPAGLVPYSFNLKQAWSEMNNSPWPYNPAGNNGQGSGGYPASNTLNYEYVDTPVWFDVASLLQQDLLKIGIHLNLVAVSLANLFVIQGINPTTGHCYSQESGTVFHGPFPIGLEFYTSDYISPDDWTQNVALSTGSANQCMAGYRNATMDALVLQGAGEHNPAAAKAEYTQMTQMMYQNYTDAWLVVPTAFSVTSIHLKGAVSNPMGSGIPYVMMYNTEYAG